MASKLWFSKGITKISSTMKKVIKKTASHLNKGIKEAWSFLFSSKKVSFKERDEGLFATLFGTFQDEDIWVIDSGATRHRTGHSHRLKTLSKRKSAYSVELGDNKSYPVKCIGSTSINLEEVSNIHLNNILFVPSLHKNLLSISSLEDKGDRVAFRWKSSCLGKRLEHRSSKSYWYPRRKALYRLISPVNQALVHTEISPCELWH